MLVVDDCEFTLKIIYGALMGAYNILSLRDGESVVPFVCEGQLPDLILLDITLPGMTGLDVCKQLKDCAQTKEIPIIFITSCDDQSSELEGLALGAVDYITKPLNIPILHARVKAHVKQIVAIDKGVATIISEPKAETSDTQSALIDPFTHREREVLARLANGLSNKEIATRLSIEEVTVRLHLRNAYRKMGVRNRVQAVTHAVVHGYVTLTHNAAEETVINKWRILDDLFMYIAILDETGIVLDINAAPIKESGLARKDVIGISFLDGPWWQHDERVRTCISDALEAAKLGRIVRFNTECKIGDNIETIDFQISPLRDADGMINGLMPIAVPTKKYMK